MLLEDEVQKLVAAVKAQAVYDIFCCINQTAITCGGQGDAAAVVVRAEGEGWSNQLVMVGPN